MWEGVIGKVDVADNTLSRKQSLKHKHESRQCTYIVVKYLLHDEGDEEIHSQLHEGYFVKDGRRCVRHSIFMQRWKVCRHDEMKE